MYKILTLNNIAVINGAYGELLLSNRMGLTKELQKSASDQVSIYEIDQPRGSRDTYNRAIMMLDGVNSEILLAVRQIWQQEILSGIESEAQRKESGGNVTNIYIGGNVSGSNIVSGNNNVVTQKIQDSFNKADAADIQAELKKSLKQLVEAVAVMNKSLPAEQAAEAAEDLSKLVDEATKPKPNKKWYSVSVDGLVKAAENLGKVGEPVVTLAGRVLGLLLGLPGK